jgi:hypothetical protein
VKTGTVGVEQTFSKDHDSTSLPTLHPLKRALEVIGAADAGWNQRDSELPRSLLDSLEVNGVDARGGIEEYRDPCVFGKCLDQEFKVLTINLRGRAPRSPR